ncbi:MAG: Uma2 family endonuclease [Segetibacter sp.]
MSNSEILEKLVKSPNALKIIEEAQSVFEKEKIERQKFYDLTHENFKAEFINGEIIFHSPVRLSHWDVSMKLSSLLHVYVTSKALGKVGVEKVMVRLTRNDYEPDICYYANEKVAKFSSNQLSFPAPDFVVEILSDSTEKIDRGVKFVDYAAHGVSEYWIVDPIKKTVEKYLLEQGEYLLEVKLQSEGKLQSSVIEGFVIEMHELF